MNLKKEIGRSKFIIWSLVLLISWYLILAAGYNGAYDSNIGMIGFWVVFAFVASLTILVAIRRLQDSGYSAWLAVLLIIMPPLWFALLVPPSKSKSSK